ncbi:hypothetical protein BpHYR1_026060 [Brachionus plicatilis]|uniref:Uncharacterized protein n=1 Tax=Brachionus plicatilis TaxID=10195 RepID=A0A3M7Q522_BRAPC|nr:hypothetical protein BpHYR1_026060 [Brachionus plicatilis]
MAACKFIAFLKKQNGCFDFKIFKKDYLVQLSPNKTSISYHASPNDTAFLFRDSIVANLALNEYFYQDVHEVSSFNYFCQLLEETELGITNENQIARLTLLLHVSKSLIDDQVLWDNIFQIIPTLEIDDQIEFIFKNDLIDLFNGIKSNQKIVRKINQTIISIIGLQEVKFDYSSLKIKFFKFSISELNGFAGLDCVYIGIDAIRRFVCELRQDFDNEQKLKIFLINMFRLIIHEICHVALRKVVKNFNASSPTLITQRKQQSNSDSFKKNAQIFEAGVLCEKIFFSERIDWALSSKSTRFNFAYCENFFEKLLSKSEAELPQFDFNKSGCIRDTSKFLFMAIDYSRKIQML